jgi:hypothetical protein
MGSPVRIRFDQGLVTARDRADLRLGEMQTATGIYYKTGDPARAWKIGGRGASSTSVADGTITGGAKVKGLYLAQFDSGGTDLLLGLTTVAAAGALYIKVPTLTGTWSAIASAFTTAAAVNLSGVHYNNRHYLCNGQDINVVLESDGTTRTMGLQPPNVRPTTGVSTAAQVLVRAASGSLTNDYAPAENWQNVAGAVGAADADAATFSYVTVNKADVTQTAKEQVWTFAANAAAGRRLEVIYRVTTGHIKNNPGEDIGSGGGKRGRFRVRAIITYSTDGVTYGNTLLNAVLRRSMNEVMTLQVPYAPNSSNLLVKCSLQALAAGDPVQLQIADIRTATGGAAANITTTTGFYYAFTEYDSARNQESSGSPESAIVTMAAQNLVTLTLPSAGQNSRATHWRIYRTPDGGSVPSQLGRIAEIPIAQTAFSDAFDIAFDFQASHIIPLLPMQASSGQEYVALNDPPPQGCKQFFVHRGRIIGITGRALAYSEPGLPESWPAVNSDSDFALKEGDTLVVGVSLGDIIVAFCSQTVVTLLDVPSWTDGTFRTTHKSTLPNAPGCVGQDAVAVFTTGSGLLAAWVSPYGIYVTDGHTARRVSDDQAWTTILTQTVLSTSVLHWDKNRQCLVFAYDVTGSGANDRFALIHMAPEHQKETGLPLWTGPHYGGIASMASGIVGGTPRLWSGAWAAGVVYVEDTGTTDAASSYSGTQVPLIVLTGRLYGDTLAPALSWRDWATYKARLRHTAAGGAETVSAQWTTGRDGTGTTQVVTKTPSIVSQQANEFYVGLGGEWAEVQLTHTGSASWGILDLTADTMAMGRSGRVA